MVAPWILRAPLTGRVADAAGGIVKNLSIAVSALVRLNLDQPLLCADPMACGVGPYKKLLGI